MTFQLHTGNDRKAVKAAVFGDHFNKRKIRSHTWLRGRITFQSLGVTDIFL